MFIPSETTKARYTNSCKFSDNLHSNLIPHPYPNSNTQASISPWKANLSVFPSPHKLRSDPILTPSRPFAPVHSQRVPGSGVSNWRRWPLVLAGNPLAR